ncbi:MAG: hypothetical protein VB031_07255 [Eubacteriaceae bacterium]|nr:hypothetical protein [Eubacteriaceae bacterium]
MPAKNDTLITNKTKTYEAGKGLQVLTESEGWCDLRRGLQEIWAAEGRRKDQSKDRNIRSSIYGRMDQA